MTEAHTTETENLPASQRDELRIIIQIATILLCVILVAVWLVLVGVMVFPALLTHR